MKTNAVIDRVLHATAASPLVSNPWGSPEDPCEDNPWNKQRLRNDFAMEDYLESTPGITEEWAALIHEACQMASRDGKSFDPLRR